MQYHYFKNNLVKLINFIIIMLVFNKKILFLFNLH